MEQTVLAVGADVDDRAVRCALERRGLRVRTGEADLALVEWRRDTAPDAIVVGARVAFDARESICRHVKLHRRLNHIPVLVLNKGGRPGPPEDGIRVEPDLYLSAAVRPRAMADSAARALADAQERADSGVSFHLQAVIGSNLRSLADVSDLLQQVLWVTKLGELAAQRVRYATLEMALNAIEWGNRWQKQSGVWFGFTISGDRFCATVADEGKGFDAQRVVARSSVPHPEEQEEERKAAGLRLGGYGFHVARRFVDELEYNRKGNMVTLIKYLHGTRKP